MLSQTAVVEKVCWACHHCCYRKECRKKSEPDVRPNHTNKLTAAVLILSIGTVQDSIAAQYGWQAEVIQTLVLSRRAVILRRNSARQQRRTELFIWAVIAVQLFVTPPALWNALKGICTLVLVHTAGQRLRRHWSWVNISQNGSTRKLNINVEGLKDLESSFNSLRII